MGDTKLDNTTHGNPAFRPIARVLRDGTFSVFQWLPLLWHALFPSSFRSQVNQMTQEHSSGFLLSVSGIQHRVPRRTLSPHPALITRPMVALPRRAPPHRWVDPTTKLGDWAPSLQAHYRPFHATTSP